jgi:hypothetical protein
MASAVTWVGSVHNLLASRLVKCTVDTNMLLTSVVHVPTTRMAERFAAGCQITYLYVGRIWTMLRTRGP